MSAFFIERIVTLIYRSSIEAFKDWTGEGVEILKALPSGGPGAPATVQLFKSQNMYSMHNCIEIWLKVNPGP